MALPRGTAVFSLITILLGGWLIAAPLALSFEHEVAVAWNDIIIGVLVVILAGVSTLAVPSPPRR